METMKTPTILMAALLAATMAGGCNSIQHAGVTSYHVKTPDAEITVHNGKEMQELEASLEKSGNDYKFHIRQAGVKAFKGQELAGNAVTDATKTAAKATAAVLVAPAAAAVGAAAIGALAR